MPGAQLYDTIGATYPVTRRTEPRIAEQIWAALGEARTVLNVGAGTGSYEPPDRYVLAVEPSALMRAQRSLGAAPCLAGAAEDLPFDDQSFDAAMAVCTVIGLFLAPAALGLYVVAQAFTNLPRFISESVGAVAYPNIAASADRRVITPLPPKESSSDDRPVGA